LLGIADVGDLDHDVVRLPARRLTVDEDEAGAPLGEPAGDGRADPAQAAGDDDDRVVSS
jgi:hypothetical protein